MEETGTYEAATSHLGERAPIFYSRYSIVVYRLVSIDRLPEKIKKLHLAGDVRLYMQNMARNLQVDAIDMEDNVYTDVAIR